MTREYGRSRRRLTSFVGIVFAIEAVLLGQSATETRENFRRSSAAERRKIVSDLASRQDQSTTNEVSAILSSALGDSEPAIREAGLSAIVSRLRNRKPEGVAAWRQTELPALI